MILVYTDLKVSDVFRVMFVKTEWVYMIKGWCCFSISKYWVIPRTDGVRCLRSVRWSVVTHRPWEVSECIAQRLTRCASAVNCSLCARQPHNHHLYDPSNSLPIHIPMCSSLLLILFNLLFLSIHFIMPNNCIISSMSSIEGCIHLQSL